MKSRRTPFILHAWLLLTWCFSGIINAVSWLLHRRMGADPKRFAERLGHDTRPNKGPVIWFHAASLGEVIQIGPLAKHLADVAQTEILVTTTTATGANWVAQEMPDAIHRFAPVDTPAAIRRFLDGWSISVAIFIEGDLWPRLLAGLRKRDVPLVLLNARHSRTRARHRAAFAALLSPFSLVTCRSEDVAQGMRHLGLPCDKVHVLPDLRLSLPKLGAPSDLVEPLAKILGTRPVWLAASTHPFDEKVVIDAHQEVLGIWPDALLIVAPRHLHRAEPLQTLAHSKSLGTARRSLGETPSTTAHVYIADTFGELGVFFSLSPVVFLGGSFGTEGGHNPYEPARFETALVHGPNVKNFADGYAALRRAGAAICVSDPQHLGKTIADLTQSPRAGAMGRSASAFIDDTQGSVVKCADLIVRAMRHPT